MAVSVKYLDTLRDAFNKLKDIDTIENISKTSGLKFAYFGRRQFGGELINPGIHKYKMDYELINCFCIGVTIDSIKCITGTRWKYNTKLQRNEETKTYGYRIYDPVKDKKISVPESTIIYTFTDPAIYDSLEFIGVVDKLNETLK